MKKIFVFGESIIDKHYNYEVIAGAPLNVAINLKKNHMQPILLSAIGNDKYGDKIYKFLKKNKIITKYVEKKNFLETGEAIVLKKNKDNYFNIKKNCAWDEIENIPNYTPHLLYLGSIVARSKINLKTLKKIFNKKIKYIFLDINLRKPYINWNFISYMLKNKITHLKLTDNEYKFLKNKSNNFFTIQNMFKINKKLEYIALTKGSKGSEIILRNGMILKFINVNSDKVVNTIGAGDMFSALLIKGIIKKENLIDTYIKASSEATKSITKKTGY